MHQYLKVNLLGFTRHTTYAFLDMWSFCDVWIKWLGSSKNLYIKLSFWYRKCKHVEWIWFGIYHTRINWSVIIFLSFQFSNKDNEGNCKYPPSVMLDWILQTTDWTYIFRYTAGNLSNGLFLKTSTMNEFYFILRSVDLWNEQTSKCTYII
jgi:hypothetical protein